jgi:predicted nucleic acid-binding Zn ribbon protein
VVQGLLAEGAFRRGLPVARLIAGWADVVGERLAAETAPAALEGGVLTVRASDGPWGAQARYLSEQIAERADRALGGGVVSTVRVVVGATGSGWTHGGPAEHPASPADDA